MRCNLLEMEGGTGRRGHLKGKNMCSVDVLNVVSVYLCELGSRAEPAAAVVCWWAAVLGGSSPIPV